MPTVIPELPSSFTLDDLGVLFGIVFAALIAYLITLRLLRKLGTQLIGRAQPRLAALLARHHVFSILALLAPTLLLAFARPLLLARFGWMLGQESLAQLFGLAGVLIFAFSFNALLNVAEDLFVNEQPPALRGVAQGIIRWARLINIAFALVLALGVFYSVQVTWVLTALGIVAATGSIVFGDLIYNAVARALLKSRKLVQVGDWVEIPALEINGAVTEISPFLIHVQNWDNSLATVPPRYLLNQTFRNWQQMFHLGRRRIMRTLHIDVSGIRPLDAELLADLGALPGVSAFLKERAAAFGSEQAAVTTLTNVALYRVYLMHYLRTHPKVSVENLVRVTNVDSLGQGLPLLILAFLTETEDIPYRMLDAEIYEHCIAVAPRFGLQVFQAPAGLDMRALRDALP